MNLDLNVRVGPQRGWAKKILDRIAAGEHVNLIAEQYAREALGLPPKDQPLEQE